MNRVVILWYLRETKAILGIMKSHQTSSHISRRAVLQSLALAPAALSVATGARAQSVAASKQLQLGIDNFAVRAFGWNADQLIDYAATLRIDSLFITDLKPFDTFETAYLSGLRKKAADHGLRICLGSWSICPTSNCFKKDWGTAEEHLALGIRMAEALGSPVFRCVLGNGRDRSSAGGIRARIADTVKVLKTGRTRALDAGIKIAVENHAGDMQAWELVELIEAAGPEYVGANLDPGNATWTLEDPVASLEILGKYTACTSMRDSMIWLTDEGATVQWTAMGDGIVDFKTYFRRFAELCPHAPVHIETISGFPRSFPYLTPEFWQTYPEARARDLAAFIALARKGHAIDRFTPPQGVDRQAAERTYQKSDLEKSISYCRETLGLGVRR